MFLPTTNTISSSSPHFTVILPNIHTRKLLLHNPLHQLPKSASPPGSIHTHDSEFYTGERNFDTNVVMVFSVLFCALICALGLNSIVRCALRCSSRMGLESNDTLSARLANTGLKKKALKMFHTITYTAELNLPGLDTDCVICLSEFAPGERVKILPKCHHGFHARCIDKWLTSHSSCPTCRHCLINTCEKIVNGSQSSSSVPPPSVQVGIVPLEHEGLIRNYRDIS